MSKMEYHKFQISRISYSDKETLITLYSVNADTPISGLCFSLTNVRKTPYLVKAL